MRLDELPRSGKVEDRRGMSMGRAVDSPLSVKRLRDPPNFKSCLPALSICAGDHVSCHSLRPASRFWLPK